MNWGIYLLTQFLNFWWLPLKLIFLFHNSLIIFFKFHWHLSTLVSQTYHLCDTECSINYLIEMFWGVFLFCFFYSVIQFTVLLQLIFFPRIDEFLTRLQMCSSTWNFWLTGWIPTFSPKVFSKIALTCNSIQNLLSFLTC